MTLGPISAALRSTGPRQNSRQVSLEPISFPFNNALIHFLSTFKFLGYTLSKAEDMKPEVDQHRNLAEAKEPQPVPVEALNATMKCLQKHYSLGLQCLHHMSFMLQKNLVPEQLPGGHVGCFNIRPSSRLWEKTGFSTLPT